MHCKGIVAYPKTCHHANGLLSCSSRPAAKRKSDRRKGEHRALTWIPSRTIQFCPSSCLALWKRCLSGFEAVFVGEFVYGCVCLLSGLRTEPPAIAVTIIKMIAPASPGLGRQASKVGTASELRHAVCLLFSC